MKALVHLACAARVSVRFAKTKPFLSHKYLFLIGLCFWLGGRDAFSAQAHPRLIAASGIFVV
jgi:hypothetical protein